MQHTLYKTTYRHFSRITIRYSPQHATFIRRCAYILNKVKNARTISRPLLPIPEVNYLRYHTILWLRPRTYLDCWCCDRQQIRAASMHSFCRCYHRPFVLTPAGKTKLKYIATVKIKIFSSLTHLKKSSASGFFRGNDINLIEWYTYTKKPR